MNESRTDILISRLIDGEAGADEWQEFTTHAAADSSLWRELAEAQRQQKLLSAAVADTTSVAASVELPDLSEDISPIPHHHAMHIRPRVVAWVGWAVAAALAIALWSGIRPNANLSGPIGGSTGEHVVKTNLGSFAPDVLLQAYLENGKNEGNVLGELPDKVLLETRPGPAGQGYEVLYIRPILERTHVLELYEFTARDEAGRPMLARYEGRPPRPM